MRTIKFVQNLNQKYKILHGLSSLHKLIAELGGEVYENVGSSEQISLSVLGFRDRNSILIMKVPPDMYDVYLDDLLEDEMISLIFLHRNCYYLNEDVISEEQAKELVRLLHLDPDQDLVYDGIRREYWVTPVSAYIHSGVYFYPGYADAPCDPCGWDSSHAGCLLISKELARTRDEVWQHTADFLTEINNALWGESMSALVPIPSSLWERGTDLQDAVERLQSMPDTDILELIYDSMWRGYNERQAAEYAAGVLLEKNRPARARLLEYVRSLK